MRMAKMMKKEQEGGWGEGTEVKEMQGGDCWEREARRGLLGKRCKEGTVVKEKQGEIQAWDCGEREARRDTRRGLW